MFVEGFFFGECLSFFLEVNWEQEATEAESRLNNQHDTQRTRSSHGSKCQLETKMSLLFQQLPQR